MATANSNAGLNGWYLSMLMHKEGWSRLGFFGYDLQDQCGSANCMSIRPDEGLLGELRGPNYPNYAMNVGHQGEYAAIAGCCPHCTWRCLDPVPADEDHIRRPVAQVRLLRSPPRVCKGCNPRVHARRRALTDHPSKVRPIQHFFLSFSFPGIVSRLVVQEQIFLPATANGISKIPVPCFNHPVIHSGRSPITMV